MSSIINYVREAAIAIVVLPVIGIIIALSGKSEFDD